MSAFKLRGGMRCPTCKARKIIRTGRVLSTDGSSPRYELRCEAGHVWFDSRYGAGVLPRSFDRYLPRTPIKWD